MLRLGSLKYLGVCEVFIGEK